MRQRSGRIVAGTAVVILVMAAFAYAADLTKATNDAEGRRKAAESGARTIRSKATQVDGPRDLYVASANAHDAWLDATKNLIEKGDSDGAVSEAAGRAASALVKWVAGRNAALGEPVLSGKIADNVEASIRQDLIDISVETARRQRTSSAEKKGQAASDLGNRLRWKDWNEL